MASLFLMQGTMRIVLGVVGLILAVAAVVGWRVTTDTPSGDVEAVEQLLVPDSSGTPDEVSTTTALATATTDVVPLWNVNEQSLLVDLDSTDRPVPVRLRIEKLAIDAPIDGYGVDPQGRMDVPDNVTDVGWYQYGPSPGQAGSAVLAAHVDLAGPGRGLFFNLDELVQGDRIEIELSDGSSLEFTVTAQTSYLKSDLPLDVIFSREGSPVLTLVTCGGGFSRSSRSYDSNVVVYAVPTT